MLLSVYSTAYTDVLKMSEYETYWEKKVSQRLIVACTPRNNCGDFSKKLTNKYKE